MKNLMKYLRSTLMVTTVVKPRGLLITIKNYDSYQNLNNYENSSEDSNKKTSSKPIVNQMPLSINKNDKELKNEKNIYSENSDEFRLSGLLLNFILERNPKNKKQDLQKWAMHISRMIRLDSRKADDIEAVIKWSQGDMFWQNIIISTQKLRDKFDQLKMKMEAGDAKRKTTNKFTNLDNKDYTEGAF